MHTVPEFTLPLHSRVWIYQSSRFLTPGEVNTAKDAAHHFLADWNSHGNALSAEIHVVENLFLVIAVDEAKAMASGCSIDKSVRLVKDLENSLGVSFTGRTTMAYIDEQDKIHLQHYADFKKEIESGKMKSSTLVFNNLISTLADLKNRWITPASESWLADIKA
jgi:hypothetical protein